MDDSDSQNAPVVDVTSLRRVSNESSDDDAEDEEKQTGGDDHVDRPTTVVEGERIDADEDLLDDYPVDTDDIACLHSRIRSLPNLKLERFPNVKTLCLRQNEVTKIENLPSQLVELDLYDNLISHMEGLDDLVELTSLDLSFNRIKHIKKVDHLTKLKTFYLVQNKITRIENISGLTQLSMIELGANRIRVIENLDSLTNLTELWLGKNKITELNNLEKLTKLKILSIQSNRLLQISGLEAQAKSLEELYISHNGITSLDGLAPLKRLRVLDISNNRISNLTHISHLEHLEELWASNNLLESFQEIERECKHLTKLDTVYFEGNPMQRQHPTTYRNKVKLAVYDGIKQIDANILRS